jgi:hypothetical protein
MAGPYQTRTSLAHSRRGGPFVAARVRYPPKRWFTTLLLIDPKR